MRVFTIASALAAGLYVAVVGTGMGSAAPMSKKVKMGAVSPAMIARGKTISAEKRCNTCHGADLKGKPGFAPSLHADGVLKEYNAKTWARVLDTGVTNDGKPVKKPMPVYHLKAKDSAALWAYFKSVK